VSEEDDDGLGLGLLDEGLGVGLLDDGLGVGLAETAELGLAAGLVVLADTAVSWAAHGFAAAGAALAVPVSKAPARPAGMMTNPEITPNAWAVARRLLMDPPSPPWSSPSGSRSLP
jgi:hypothetical protein